MVGTAVEVRQGMGGPHLCPRERQVLDLVAEGLVNKQIARRLGLSVHTVAGLVKLLMRTSGTHTRGALVSWAWQRKVKSN